MHKGNEFAAAQHAAYEDKRSGGTFEDNDRSKRHATGREPWEDTRSGNQPNAKGITYKTRNFRGR